MAEEFAFAADAATVEASAGAVMGSVAGRARFAAWYPALAADDVAAAVPGGIAPTRAGVAAGAAKGPKGIVRGDLSGSAASLADSALNWLAGTCSAMDWGALVAGAGVPSGLVDERAGGCS